jgi:hypothetical protein
MIQPKPPKERNDLELLELVCQLHSKSVTYYHNKEMHDAYIEARKEMESRLVGYAASQSYPRWVNASERLPISSVNNNFKVKHSDGRETEQYWNGTGFINFKTFAWNYFSDIIEWLEETPSSIQEGEERMFSLKDALEIWECGYDQGYWDENEYGSHLGEHGDEKFNYEKKNKYFKEKFGINLEK